jgi:hypothetical protein
MRMRTMRVVRTTTRFILRILDARLPMAGSVGLRIR